MLITGPGLYKSRDGRMWRVEHNLTGWLDGLPFVACWPNNEYGQESRYSFTCNEEGLIWPENHRMFCDDNGFYQPDLFGDKKRWQSPYDLVERISP